eukprot:6205111-Pyramimonas_sp.AAC.1
MGCRNPFQGLFSLPVLPGKTLPPAGASGGGGGGVAIVTPPICKWRRRRRCRSAHTRRTSAGRQWTSAPPSAPLH